MRNSLFLIPLDSRPVNTELPREAAAHAGLAMSRPPLNALGGLKKPADRKKVFSSLYSSRQPWALLISLDMAAYGGLVHSRTPDTSPGDAMKALTVIREYKKKFPDVRIYAFSTVPRDAITAADSNSFNEWRSQMKGIVGGKSALRDRNLRIVLEMIRWAGEGIFDFLLIGKEDTAEGNPNRGELEEIGDAIERVCPDRIALASGTDELAMILTARATADFYGCHPCFSLDMNEEQAANVPMYEPFPLAQTIEAQIFSSSAWVSKSPNGADAVISIHTAGRQRDIFLESISGKSSATAGIPVACAVDDTISRVAKMTEAGIHVALVDAEVINGASSSLVKSLIDKEIYFKLSSYAGWNTTANSSGTAIAFAAADYIARSLNEERAAKGRVKFLMNRLYSDCFYSLYARPRVMESGAKPFSVENSSGFPDAIRGILEEKTDEVLGDYLAGKPFPADPGNIYMASIKEFEIRKVILPWKRLFEADIRLKYQVDL